MTAIPPSTLTRSLPPKPAPRKAGRFAGQERWLTLGAAVFALVSALAVVVGLTGLAVAAFTTRRAVGPQRAGAWGIILRAVTGLLASPISWTHHWVWCLPLLVLLSAEAAREARTARGRRHLGWRITAVAVWIAFASKAMWRVNGRHTADLHLPYWKMLCADIYPLLGLALLAVAAARLLVLPVGPGRVRQESISSGSSPN